jgi:hypothetical protein
MTNYAIKVIPVESLDSSFTSAAATPSCLLGITKTTLPRQQDQLMQEAL